MCLNVKCGSESPSTLYPHPYLKGNVIAEENDASAMNTSKTKHTLLIEVRHVNQQN